MKYLIVCLCLLWLVMPATAQDESCDPNIAPATAFLLEADTALTDGDVDAALGFISQAKGILETIEASCVEFAEPGAGDSRLNPVPLGQRAQHTVFDETDASVEITGFEEDVAELVAEANQFNDPPDEGMRYVMINFNYYCELDPAEMCAFGRHHYNLVGSNGLVYEAASVSGDEFSGSTELFGGAQAALNLVYMVGEDDSDFVLFNAYDEPVVYWATE